jgi:hypothetical protein
MPDRNVLRFGIICESLKIEDWKLSCINEMQKKKQAELSLIIRPVRTGSSLQKRNFPMTPSGNKRFKSLKLQDIMHKCSSIPVLEYREEEKCKEQIKQAELDFVIDFDGTVGSGISTHCKYGVWAFQQGDEQSYLYGSSCFWEIYNNESVTAVSLYRCTANKEEKIILKKGYFATVKDSHMKNKEHICSSVTFWPSMVCEDLLNGNADYLNEIPVVSKARAYGSPTQLQWLFFYCKLLRNKMKKLITQLFCYEYWNVGLVNQSIEQLLNEPQPDIKWLVEKKDLYYADPFGYEENGNMHILMEELDHKVVNGYISKLDVNLICNKEVTFHSSIIKLPSHMSYPYILYHDGDVYCIPETSEENEVAVYQLNKKTKDWVKTRTILEGFPAVDATIIKHGEKWWMFCTRGRSESQSHNDELHIYYSDELFGKWEAHKQNPVKIDIRSSRPAGTPFYHEGSLYRPAQDCSETYGGRIVLNKIKTLTTAQFIEETVSHVQPGKNSLYPDGVHTLSSVNKHWTLIDGKRFDYSIFHILKKLHKFKPSKQLGIEKYANKRVHERNV